jgi:hypothetical protein
MPISPPAAQHAHPRIAMSCGADGLRSTLQRTIPMPSAIETHYTADFESRKEIVEKFLYHRYL